MKNLFIKGLPDDLARQLKIRAAEESRPLRELVIAALTAYVAAEGSDIILHTTVDRSTL